MKIPFSPPDITEQEAQEVSAALLSGWITTGPRTKEFERQIAAFCESNMAVCQNSATACLESILQILGIGSGDESDLVTKSSHRHIHILPPQVPYAM